MSDTFKEPETHETYAPDDSEQEAIREVIETFQKGKDVLVKGYNYFQGGSLYDVIDDWTKRWNGFIPPMNPLIDQTQSQIFVNFTRNAVIFYLSQVAMAPVKSHIVSTNKQTGLPNQKFAGFLEDLNRYSLNEESGDKKFIGAALECAVKGTVVVYEGYAREEQDGEVVEEFNATTGEVTTSKEKVITFDNCFQEVVPLEDFFITNAFQPDVQKQPKIIWRQITSKSEAEGEFEHYRNFKYVTSGRYAITDSSSTFYRELVMTQLKKDQVEILRYYNRSKNRHIICANGVVLYDGVIPFKDGMYPFAKAINEPFANDFFWGNGHPNKYMGEQDLINSFINMMADKTFASMSYTGLSSDLDDLVEDDTTEIGKWRKVGDIEKWKYLESPAINSGEVMMFQQVLGLAQESAATQSGNTFSPKGGKLQTKQVMMKQQEQLQKLSFNMQFLEDLERDRTRLRISHILQFYSIPRMDAITGKDSSQLSKRKVQYRDIHLDDVKLSDGRKGTRIIKLIGDEHKHPAKRKQLADSLSIIEHKGEIQGTPTEAIAVSVDLFDDFTNEIQVVKNSSYQKNQALDQAVRMEFATWRFGLQQVPVPNPKELVSWVEESFDIDTDRFETAPQQTNQGGIPGLPQPPQMGPDGTPQNGNQLKPQVLQNNAPSSLAALAK